jgi:hypothetical protein
LVDLPALRCFFGDPQRAGIQKCQRIIHRIADTALGRGVQRGALLPMSVDDGLKIFW